MRVSSSSEVSTPPIARGRRYGDQSFKVEPYGVEAIPASERHGRATSSFTLWASANLNILTWFTGSLGVSMGLPFIWAWKAILLGNFLGAVLLGLTSAIGITTGEPQLISTRRSFTLRGARFPAALNWITLVGWFGVDIVLGVFALQHLLGLSYLPALFILTVAAILMAIFGYNMMHSLARLATLSLGILFTVMTVVAVHAAPAPSAGRFSIGLFIATAAFSFAYLFSFSPLGSDFSRYLPEDTSQRAVASYTALGGFIVASWLEILGAATAALGAAAHPMALLAEMMGAFAVPALLTVAVSTLPVNAMALYSGGLSALAAGVPLRRWVAAFVTGGLGAFLMVWGGGAFAAVYKNFLLLLSYWIAPWLGIILVDFYVNHNREIASRAWPAMLSFMLGLVASIPFMDSILYQGYVATHYLGGGDVSYLVGMAVSGLCYHFWIRLLKSRHGD
ncbi:MAG: cytosine permease [Chloroflexi bacterium]|nr:cytosine permease [Chloroflexota bacterium]